MWNLAFKNIKEIWRDKKVLVTSLIFPILLFLVSQYILKHTTFFTENIPLAVVNGEIRGQSPMAGRLLVTGLRRAVSSQRGHSLYAIDETNEEEALRKLQDGEITGVLLIPRGFSEQLEKGVGAGPQKITLILNDADPRAGILAGSLTGYVNHFGMLVNRSQGQPPESRVWLSTIKQGPALLPPEYESLANVTLFAFLFLIPYAAGQWVSEIERGSLTRFRLSLTSPAQLFGGVFLSTLFLAFFQAALLLSAAFLLDLRPHLLLLWIWPMALIFVLASMGLGMILSSWAEKEKQLNLLSSLVLIPLFLISGSLGKELMKTGWTTHLPWSQGYSILCQVLSYQNPDAKLLLQVTASSLALAILGALLFTARRLRYV